MRDIQEILNDIKLEDLQKLGHSTDLVFAKMRFYAPWPAQIIPDQVLPEVLKVQKGTSNVRVMFFGRREVAYVPKKKVAEWSTGAKRFVKQTEKELSKSKNSTSPPRRELLEGINEALDYLTGYDNNPRPYWDDVDDETSTVDDVSMLDDDLRTTLVGSEEGSNDPNRSTGQGTSTREGDQTCRDNQWVGTATPKGASDNLHLYQDCKKMEGAPSILQDTSEEVSIASLGEGSRTGTGEGQITPEQTLDDRLNEYRTTNELVWKIRHSRPKILKEGDVEKCNCSQGMDNCRENCILKAVQIRCDPRLCPCGDACDNKPFDRIQVPSIIPFMTSDKGVGIKANEHIPEGAFIIEYTGEVIDKEELTRRFEKTKNAPGKYMDYYMQLQSGLWIDARNQGNLSRFINSSCEPNCSAERYTDAATNQQRIGIFARIDISPGTELTYDYLMEPIHHKRYSEHLQCRCGAGKCRGWTLRHESKGGSSSKKKRGRQQLEEIDAGNQAMEMAEEQVADESSQDRVPTAVLNLERPNKRQKSLQTLMPVCGMPSTQECAKCIISPAGILCGKPTQVSTAIYESGKLDVSMLDVGAGV